MLRQRVLTAIVLLAVLLPAVFAPAVWPFALLTLLGIGAAGWEWGRLNGLSSGASALLGAAIALAGFGAYAAGWVERAPPTLCWR